MKANQLRLIFIYTKKYTNSFGIEIISFDKTDTITKKGGNSFLLNLAASVLCGSET